MDEMHSRYTCPLRVLAAEVCVEWQAATSTILLNQSRYVNTLPHKHHVLYSRPNPFR